MFVEQLEALGARTGHVQKTQFYGRKKKRLEKVTVKFSAVEHRQYRSKNEWNIQPALPVFDSLVGLLYDALRIRTI